MADGNEQEENAGQKMESGAVTTTQPQAKQDGGGLAAELWKKKAYILKAFVVLAVFWMLEFAYQYYVLIPGELNGALVRSFALGGATLIGVALSIGPIATLFPKYNYVEYRRTVGVAGFTLVAMHVLSVIIAFYGGNPFLVFWNLNPFGNPVLFGAMAFLLFVPIFATSTDWALKKLGYSRWKTIHRAIYFAFLLSVLHFALINPELLFNPAGYLLVAVTLIALLAQLAGFVKRVRAKQELSRGAWIGFGIIALYVILLAVAFFFNPAA